MRQSLNEAAGWRAQLDEGHVLVCRVALDDAVACANVLDCRERERAARFVFESDRQRFVAAHVALRQILGSVLAISPEQVRFEHGAYGKPRMAPGPCDLRVNLSHASGVALVAMAIGREVGVDIEFHRDIDIQAMCAHVCSPAETEVLMQLPPGRRRRAFFRCWTRKESFVKARGDGLNFPLRELDVSLDEETTDALVRCVVEPGALSRWRIITLPSDEQWSAALTIEREDVCPTVSCLSVSLSAVRRAPTDSIATTSTNPQPPV